MFYVTPPVGENTCKYNISLMSFCIFYFPLSWSVQWAGPPLPDRVHSKRGTLKGLPQRALLWWVSALLKLVSTLQWFLNLLLRVASCPLVASCESYLMHVLTYPQHACYNHNDGIIFLSWLVAACDPQAGENRRCHQMLNSWSIHPFNEFQSAGSYLQSSRVWLEHLTRYPLLDV